MKLPPARTAAFLQDPGATRVVLLHGEDEGLVRHRADALTKSVVGAPDDPFRVAWLSREDHPRLLEEATAIAMLGGRRVVRIRDTAESLLPAIEQVLATPGDSLVILESTALQRRSKLLTAIEAAPAAAAIPCYPAEPQELRTTIAQLLDAAGVKADPDALDWLRDHLGSDHATTRSEVEKAILYAGPARRLDLDAVRACVGDQAATSMDDAVYAATLGRIEEADRAVERAFAEGLAPVGLLRGMLSHMVRIHAARGRMEAGDSPEAAVKGLRPPVFWKRERDMVRSVAAWPTPRVSAALTEIRRAELACKQAGAPDHVIARRLVAALARTPTRR